MSSTLQQTRKAHDKVKGMVGLPMIVDIVNGASTADAIQNTLTITWVFAARAALIVASVEEVQYWMILIVSAWAGWKFCRQISRVLLVLEFNNHLFSKSLEIGAMIVTVLLSFGGLADGMFPDLQSYWALLEPKNAMKLLTITIISIAPITTIKVGMKAIMHQAGEAVRVSNNGELQIVHDELEEIQEAESKKHTDDKKKKINKGKNAPKSIPLTKTA